MTAFPLACGEFRFRSGMGCSPIDADLGRTRAEANEQKRTAIMPPGLRVRIAALRQHGGTLQQNLSRRYRCKNLERVVAACRDCFGGATRRRNATGERRRRSDAFEIGERVNAA